MGHPFTSRTLPNKLVNMGIEEAVSAGGVWFRRWVAMASFINKKKKGRDLWFCVTRVWWCCCLCAFWLDFSPFIHFGCYLIIVSHYSIGELYILHLMGVPFFFWQNLMGVCLIYGNFFNTFSLGHKSRFW